MSSLCSTTNSVEASYGTIRTAMSARSLHGPILVRLVEPHRLVRYGLKVLLDSQPDIRVVDEVDSVADALTPRGEPVDVVVLNSESRGALSSLAHLVSASARTRVVVLTGNDERGREAIRLGAAAAVVTEHAAEQLARVIQVIHRGGITVLA